MTKFFAIAALAVSLAFPMASHASTCDEGACDVTGEDGQNLSEGVFFSLTDISNGTTGGFIFLATFNNDTGTDADAAVSVLAFAPSAFGTIANLIVSIFDDVGTLASFNITDASGNAINPTGNDVVVRLPLAGFNTQLVGLDIQGNVLPGVGGSLPDLNVAISAVPLPAGILLMGTMIAGFGVMSRRKKKAA